MKITVEGEQTNSWDIWIKWGQIADINQKRKRNMANLSFCKQQAKRNDPECNPAVEWGGGPRQRQGSPKM